MNQIFTQDTRIGRLSTVLGKDVLVLLRFSGEDHINELFEYHVDALSTEPNIDFNKLIGTHATVELLAQDGSSKWYDGMVAQARWGGVGENGNVYHLTLRPWLWITDKRRQQRIFHNKTVVNIVEEVLSTYSGLGKPHIENRLKGEYPELEYTVQYRESDLNFVCRQMERFGISYHFVHQDGNHVMVLTDAVDSHDKISGDTRPYFGVDGHHQAEEEHFWEWYPESNLVTGAIRLTDWNFKTPTAAMEVDKVGTAAYAEGQWESYDFPGDYLDQGSGKDVAALRLEQERGQDLRLRATGDCTSLGAGMRVTLTGDAPKGQKDQSFICLSATHSYVSDAYGSGGTDSDGYAYSGTYVLMPEEAPLAPDRKTPVPTVHGCQTAIVVGEGEIDPDEYGRILVHFPWDLDKAYSMRCRVSQNWAGKGWGGMVIPRIGMEVVVDYIEGNPDWPLVTGCVYNGKNDVPYELPAHKTRSTFRTDTHQGKGFNELRFEDENGREEIYMHAQKDMNVGVENNASRQIGANDHNQVGRNSTHLVGGLEAEYAGLGRMIGSGGSVTIEGGRTPTVAAVSGAFYRDGGTIGYPFAAMVRDAEAHSSMRPGSVTVSARADVAIQAGGEVTIGSNQSMSYSSQDSVSFVSGDDFRVTTAQSNVQHSSGNTVFASEGAMILRAGNAEIVMRPNGDIAISGAKITVNGDTIWLN